jgi:transcriptional regulator with XRE-family HTH domain
MANIRTAKQFIAQLKQARMDRDLTQSELGKMVGMSQKKIAMIENLSASPRLDVLLVIASALRLNLSVEHDHKLSSDSDVNKKVSLVWD